MCTELDLLYPHCVTNPKYLDGDSFNSRPLFFFLEILSTSSKAPSIFICPPKILALGHGSQGATRKRSKTATTSSTTQSHNGTSSSRSINTTPILAPKLTHDRSRKMPLPSLPWFPIIPILLSKQSTSRMTKQFIRFG